MCARLTWRLRQFKLCRTKVPGAFPFQAWYFDCIIVFNCPLLNTLLVSHARVTGKPYFQPNHTFSAPSDCLIIFSSFCVQACCDVIVLINPRPIRRGPLVLSYEPIWCGKSCHSWFLRQWLSNLALTIIHRSIDNCNWHSIWVFLGNDYVTLIAFEESRALQITGGEGGEDNSFSAYMLDICRKTHNSEKLAFCREILPW